MHARTHTYCMRIPYDVRTRLRTNVSGRSQVQDMPMLPNGSTIDRTSSSVRDETSRKEKGGIWACGTRCCRQVSYPTGQMVCRQLRLVATARGILRGWVNPRPAPLRVKHAHGTRELGTVGHQGLAGCAGRGLLPMT